MSLPDYITRREQLQQEREEKKRKDQYYREHIDEALEFVYVHFREKCCELEELFAERSDELSPQNIKRLDKSITVMKVGFKLLKKVMKSNKKKNITEEDMVGILQQARETVQPIIAHEAANERLSW